MEKLREKSRFVIFYLGSLLARYIKIEYAKPPSRRREISSYGGSVSKGFLLFFRSIADLLRDNNANKDDARFFEARLVLEKRIRDKAEEPGVWIQTARNILDTQENTAVMAKVRIMVVWQKRER